jgi:methylenetetrahydrofolate dehydrogenase (NADP+)/methenyltetrahydrofolate cyclohydrolase
MTARIIDGKAHAASLRSELKATAAALAAQGVQPGLAMVIVGENAASRTYVRNKVRACEEAGVFSQLHKFPADASEEALLARIRMLNTDRRIDGVLVQLPLPAHFDEARILAAVRPEKDVDGFHVHSAGALLVGAPHFVPCTPAGIMYLLEKENIPVAGRHAVVIGRSNIVGKPAALLLLQKDATVTICHSKTPELTTHTRRADILVAAAGRMNLVSAAMVKPGACVIDVGTNRDPDGNLRGDVDFDAVKEVAGSITPVPGGVGPMTVAMLLANTLRAAAQRIRKLNER